jgi:hypothetical protein
MGYAAPARPSPPNGATVSQLMAIFGWATAKQAVHYVEEANQPKIASSAMHLIVANDG